MFKRDNSIDPNRKPVNLLGYVQPALRSMMFIDSQYAAYYRAFALSMGFLVVGTGLIWLGDKSSSNGVMVAGMVLFLLAETIWLGISGVLLWKLSRTLIGRIRVGRHGIPGEDRNQKRSGL